MSQKILLPKNPHKRPHGLEEAQSKISPTKTETSHGINALIPETMQSIRKQHFETSNDKARMQLSRKAIVSQINTEDLMNRGNTLPISCIRILKHT